jgi:4-amino-4-deoxy-L-arabinose transferase-like glycosyltransferase
MLVLLPLVSLGLLMEGFRRSGFGWRRRILFATIPWSVYLVLITEGLSVFRLLTKTGVSLAWLVFAIACVAWMLTGSKSPSAQPKPTAGIWLDTADRVALYFVVVIAALVGLTALVAAPNTWDSMQYHMPRVVEWIANRGVQLYPTIDHQQLSMPPFAEYTMLHLYLLFGSDGLVNLVQWFAYCGCILAVTLIVEELGGDRRAQVFSAVLAATLPSAILGASGTKNDQVLAYWITLMVYFLIHWETSHDWTHTLALGSTISLAIFSKGTAYTFIPLLVVACMFLWGKIAIRQFIFRLPIFALLILVVSTPLWVRNHQFSGAILGPPYFPGAGTEETRLIRNSNITPARTVACTFRNIALHTGVPSERVNAFSTRVFSQLIRSVGVDPDDLGQMAPKQSGPVWTFSVPRPTRVENTSNPVHFLLFGAAVAIYLICWKRMSRSAGILGLGIIGAFILYSALVRWTPSNTRYHLPLFVVAAAFIALVLVKVLPRTAMIGLSFLLLIMSLPFALMNYTRPLLTKSGLKGGILTLPRDETYFLDNHISYAPSFIAAARTVTTEDCHSIGVDANLLHFEYPMFALLDQGTRPPRISYVSVNNASAIYKSADQPPCTVVCLECAQSTEKWHEYSDSKFPPLVFESIVVFRYPQGLPARTASANLQTTLLAK